MVTKWCRLLITPCVTGRNQNDLKCGRAIAVGLMVGTIARMTGNDPNWSNKVTNRKKVMSIGIDGLSIFQKGTRTSIEPNLPTLSFIKRDATQSSCFRNTGAATDSIFSRRSRVMTITEYYWKQKTSLASGMILLSTPAGPIRMTAGSRFG